VCKIRQPDSRKQYIDNTVRLLADLAEFKHEIEDLISLCHFDTVGKSRLIRLRMKLHSYFQLCLFVRGPVTQEHLEALDVPRLPIQG